MIEEWISFSIKDDNFQISTLGNIREVIDFNKFEYPKKEIINDRCYAVFSTRKIPIVDRLIRHFLLLKVLNSYIYYKDRDLLNTSADNILISSQSIVGRTGKCKVRPIDKAIEYRLSNLSSQTPAEQIMKNISEYTGYSYEKQAVFFNEFSFYILDYYFPKYKVAIEIDGKHHAENLRQYFYDQNRDRYLKQNYGISVIRIPNFVVLNREIREELTEKIKVEIKKQRFKKSDFLISKYMKDKVSLYKNILQIFDKFKEEVRPLEEVELQIYLKLEQDIKNKKARWLPSKREEQLLKSIVYGVLKNGKVYWKVKELTSACNSIGQVQEFNFSNEQLIFYLKHLSKYLRKFVSITTNSKRVTKGSIFYFSLNY